MSDSNGGHHVLRDQLLGRIFTRGGVEEIINLQPLGAKAKAYQVRQVRARSF